VTRPGAEGEPGAALLDALLRAAQPPQLEDAGFSAKVQARIARIAATIEPAAALAGVRDAAGRERRRGRWTIAGALAGALVATLAGRGAAMADTVDPTAPGLALLLASSVLAWLAISRN
jgi:hypothetical protein